MMQFLAIPLLLFLMYAVVSFPWKPLLALICILLVSILNAWMIEPPAVTLGINIYLHDLVFVSLLLSALIRIIFKGEFFFVSPVWLLYGLILTFGLFIGLSKYGTAAGVDFRNFFYYWSGTLYFMTFAYSDEILDKVVQYWLILCSALLLIVYFRFVAEALNLPISETWIAADSTGVRFRVINAGQTYLLGIGIIMLLLRYINGVSNSLSHVLVVLFAVAVIALQHRSVWAATLFAGLTLFCLPGIRTHKALGKIVILCFAGLILLTPLLFSSHLSQFTSSISGSAERAQDLSTGTFGNRVKEWNRLMKHWEKSEFRNQLLGDSFGGGYFGSKTSPHNFYLQSLLRTGVLGTLLLTLLYLSVLFRLYWKIWRNQPQGAYPSLLFVLIVGQLAFYIPYSPQAEHGIILGIALSLANRGMSATKGSVEPPALQNMQINPPDTNFALQDSRGSQQVIV